MQDHGLQLQTACYDIARFREQLASARTFTFYSQVATLKAAGLIKGGSLDNAVVFDGDGEPMNPEGLRFPDEWVRHKALDVFGDLSLAGLPIRGQYEATRPGHTLNRMLLEALLSDTRNFRVACD